MSDLGFWALLALNFTLGGLLFWYRQRARRAEGLAQFLAGQLSQVLDWYSELDQMSAKGDGRE